jgi:hypothetical protein
MDLSIYSLSLSLPLSESEIQLLRMSHEAAEFVTSPSRDRRRQQCPRTEASKS